MLSLEQVITTPRLQLQPQRPANLDIENDALHMLAHTLAENPQTVLQLLVDTTLKLCSADSAGISLLENSAAGEEQAYFRWVATAGQMKAFVGNIMPRTFSPCGSVLDANAMLLMNDPIKHFDYISQLPLKLREVLLVPFYQRDEPIGTLWIIAHDEDRHFDMEDARIVTSLSRFASDAAHVLFTTASAAKLQQEALEVAERRLVESAEENCRLTASERGKVEFLATLAHELRNTLSPLVNAEKLVRSTEDPKITAKALEILGRQLNHMSCLVDDLLDVAGISVGKLKLQFDTLDLAWILRIAAETNRSIIDRSGQTFNLQLPDAPLFVRGDEVRLFQVLTNLFSNAAKYGVPGGVVTVSLTADNGNAVIRVKDSGIGIERAMLAKVFELFVQLEDSNRGLGLGLALVHKLVGLHGGAVSVHSDGIGKGSEFTVRLPLGTVS